MADGCSVTRRHSPSPPPITGEADGSDSSLYYTKIAEAVAKILKPTITAAVEHAMQQGLLQIRQDIAAHASSLKEAEHRINTLEEDLLEAHAKLSHFNSLTQAMQEKIDDLENRSRRNNVRIVGLPESYQSSALNELCATTIPEALDIPSPCLVERAHRIGPPRDDTSSPRPVIARYLNYADRLSVLQRYRNQRTLDVDGHRLLLFADYSAEVAKKRKSFNEVCSSLVQKQIRFTLAYPAVLYFNATDGKRISFTDPKEAMHFLNRMEIGVGSPSTLPRRLPRSPRTPRSPRILPRAVRKYAGTPRRLRLKSR